MRDDFCKKVVANDMQSATTCHVLTKKIHHGMGPRTAGRRVCAVQAFLPQAKILAEAEFTSAEHFKHRRVKAASGRRNPQKRTSRGCPFLWKGQTVSRTPFRSALKTKSQPSPRHGPSGPRREELRRGGFAVPEHFNRKSAAALWAAKPKKKDSPKGCPSF